VSFWQELDLDVVTMVSLLGVEKPDLACASGKPGDYG
jgi:hypothetical protein